MIYIFSILAIVMVLGVFAFLFREFGKEIPRWGDE